MRRKRKKSWGRMRKRNDIRRKKERRNKTWGKRRNDKRRRIRRMFPLDLSKGQE